MRENKINLNQHSLNLLNKSKMQKNSGNTDSSHERLKKYNNINVNLNQQINSHSNFVNIYSQKNKLKNQLKDQKTNKLVQ